MPRVDRRVSALLAGLLVLGVLTPIVVAHPEPFWGEVGLVEWVNGWPRPIGSVLETVMQLGTLVGGLVALVVTALVCRRRHLRSLLAMAIAVVVAYRLDDVVKQLVDRPRPSVVLTTLTVRDHPGGTSFPSGHTTMAFAVATSIVLLLPPRWRPIPLIVASAVAVARMYVGVHWPTDLVGGAALGTSIALTSVLLVRAVPGGTAEYRPDQP